MPNNHLQKSSQAIGVFDSGVGGLTVMRQLIQAMPHENIVYFGDTARVPYGNRSAETIIRYSIENSIFLVQQSIKVLVVACNTANAHALEKLQKIFNLPIVGVIEPGAQKAVEISKTGRIAVLGTRAKVLYGAYQNAIHRIHPAAEITAIACPLFVPLVEEHLLSHAATRMIVQEYLEPVLKKDIDTLVLGCTHYPLIRHLIEEYVGTSITIVDSAHTCAERVAQMLAAEHLNDFTQYPNHKCFVSDDPEKFRSLGQRFLGMPLEHVEMANSCI